MTVKKLKLVDRVRAIAAWYIDKLGYKIDSQYLRDIAVRLCDQIVARYVEKEIYTTGNLNCCVTFGEIQY